MKKIDLNTIKLNKTQKMILDVIASGEKNILIHGAGGTGKTTIIRALKDNNPDKSVVITAPTGVAAANAGGITLHKLLGAPPIVIQPSRMPLSNNDRLDCADIIVVDEVSTCRSDIFSYLIRSMEKSLERRPRDLQLILMGDFFQLPPVVTANDKKAFEWCWGDKNTEGLPFLTKEWLKMDIKSYILNEQMRQKNQEYANHCEKLRWGDVASLTYFNRFANTFEDENATLLCARRDFADNYNKQMINTLPGKEHVYTTVRSGEILECQEVTRGVLTLKPGTRVISVLNDEEGRFANGTRGIVTKTGSGYVDVVFENGNKVSVTKHTWEHIDYVEKDGKLVEMTVGRYTQIPLIPCYAMTIHSATCSCLKRASVA